MPVIHGLNSGSATEMEMCDEILCSGLHKIIAKIPLGAERKMSILSASRLLISEIGINEKIANMLEGRIISGGQLYDVWLNAFRTGRFISDERNSATLQSAPRKDDSLVSQQNQPHHAQRVQGDFVRDKPPLFQQRADFQEISSSSGSSLFEKLHPQGPPPSSKMPPHVESPASSGGFHPGHEGPGAHFHLHQHQAKHPHQQHESFRWPQSAPVPPQGQPPVQHQGAYYMHQAQHAPHPYVPPPAFSSLPAHMPPQLYHTYPPPPPQGHPPQGPRPPQGPQAPFPLVEDPRLLRQQQQQWQLQQLMQSQQQEKALLQQQVQQHKMHLAHLQMEHEKVMAAHRSQMEATAAREPPPPSSSGVRQAQRARDTLPLQVHPDYQHYPEPALQQGGEQASTSAAIIDVAPRFFSGPKVVSSTEHAEEVDSTSSSLPASKPTAATAAAATANAAVAGCSVPREGRGPRSRAPKAAPELGTYEEVSEEEFAYYDYDEEEEEDLGDEEAPGLNDDDDWWEEDEPANKKKRRAPTAAGGGRKGATAAKKEAKRVFTAAQGPRTAGCGAASAASAGGARSSGAAPAVGDPCAPFPSNASGSAAAGTTCVECARAKVKCSKETPVCSRCVRLGCPCHPQLRGRGRPRKNPTPEGGSASGAAAGSGGGGSRSRGAGSKKGSLSASAKQKLGKPKKKKKQQQQAPSPAPLARAHKPAVLLTFQSKARRDSARYAPAEYRDGDEDEEDEDSERLSHDEDGYYLDGRRDDEDLEEDEDEDGSESSAEAFRQKQKRLALLRRTQHEQKPRGGRGGLEAHRGGGQQGSWRDEGSSPEAPDVDQEVVAAAQRGLLALAAAATFQHQTSV